MPRSYVDLTLLVWHRASWLRHRETSGQNQEKRQACSLSLHGVGQPVLQVWVCVCCWFVGFFNLPPGVSISRVFQLLRVAAHPSRNARLCEPLVLSSPASTAQLRPELPARLLGWGFPERCSQALAFAFAFPARCRNDSVWVSPPGCRWQAGERGR